MKRPISLSSHMMRRSVVALVLGTAISTFGGASQAAASETSPRTVGDISRYCTACWRNARLHPDAWTDCTQDVFTRLLERVQPNAWDRVLSADGEERREFLRAIDAVKKRSQRSRKLRRWTAKASRIVGMFWTGGVWTIGKSWTRPLRNCSVRASNKSCD